MHSPPQEDRGIGILPAPNKRVGRQNQWISGSVGRAHQLLTHINYRAALFRRVLTRLTGCARKIGRTLQRVSCQPQGKCGKNRYPALSWKFEHECEYAETSSGEHNGDDPAHAFFPSLLRNTKAATSSSNTGRAKSGQVELVTSGLKLIYSP